MYFVGSNLDTNSKCPKYIYKILKNYRVEKRRKLLKSPVSLAFESVSKSDTYHGWDGQIYEHIQSTSGLGVISSYQPTKKKQGQAKAYPCFLAGMARFELTSARVKVQCLTAWRHPIIKTFICNGQYYITFVSLCQGLICIIEGHFLPLNYFFVISYF